jgi:spore photoproduct lyase
MYTITPPAVYAHRSVADEPRYRERLDRVLVACANSPDVRVYDDDDLPRMIRDDGLLDGRAHMGTLDDPPDPILLFNTFRFDGRRDERLEWLKGFCGAGGNTAAALAGYGAFVWWSADRIGPTRICRPCWRLHFQNGCLHKCHYCGLGGLLVTMVNVEDWLERLDGLVAAHPWQETFLLEDDAEVLCLEPELGCIGPIIEHFGTLDGRYVVLHSKSANVDWMPDLAHNGNTIVVWSLAAATQARVFEPVAGSTAERIEAARKLQDAGYTVRYKFKPIIPVSGWREEAAEAVDMVFRRTRPDQISLCTFMWLSCEQMKACLNVGQLDPAFVTAAEAAAEELAGERTRPFPQALRAEVYRHYLAEIRKHDADIPVALSTESPAIWRELGPELGYSAMDYVCGCGPNSPPWRRRLACHPYRDAAGPFGGFEEM